MTLPAIASLVQGVKLPEPKEVQQIRDDPRHPAIDALSIAVDTIAHYWVLGWDLWKANGPYRRIPIMPSEVEIWYGLHTDNYGCWEISQPTLNPKLRLLSEIEEWYVSWAGPGGLQERLTTEDRS